MSWRPRSAHSGWADESRTILGRSSDHLTLGKPSSHAETIELPTARHVDRNCDHDPGARDRPFPGGAGPVGGHHLPTPRLLRRRRQSPTAPSNFVASAGRRRARHRRHASSRRAPRARCPTTTPSFTGRATDTDPRLRIRQQPGTSSAGAQCHHDSLPHRRAPNRASERVAHHRPPSYGGSPGGRAPRPGWILHLRRSRQEAAPPSPTRSPGRGPPNANLIRNLPWSVHPAIGRPV